MEKPLFNFKTPNGQFCIYNKMPSFEFLSIKQTHSNIIVDEKNTHKSLLADAIFGKTILSKCILTADCLPILIEGENGHAMIHAGWKGLQNGILFSPEILNLNPKFIFIGPHIRKENYEVPDDFKNQFPNSTSFITISNKLTFDLTNEAFFILSKYYPNAEIVDSKLCTYLNTSLHSYRRDKTIKRNYNIYIPNRS
jgi:copper oxidase (laccase) domain-containing protein